jgi:hypothetical protein
MPDVLPRRLNEAAASADQPVDHPRRGIARILCAFLGDADDGGADGLVLLVRLAQVPRERVAVEVVSASVVRHVELGGPNVCAADALEVVGRRVQGRGSRVAREHHAGYTTGAVTHAGVALAIAGFVALTLGGWLGGSVVFVHGMRVLASPTPAGSAQGLGAQSTKEGSE